MIKVRHLVIDIYSSYNNIIEWPIFSSLKDDSWTLYLSLKYPLENRHIGMVEGDQEIACKSDQDGLRLPLALLHDQSSGVHFVDLDPLKESSREKVVPT